MFPTRFLRTKSNLRMTALHRELRIKFTDIINRKLKAMQVGESGGADFVGFLLESNQTAGHRKKCRIEH